MSSSFAFLHKGPGTDGQELRSMLIGAGDPEDRVHDSEPQNRSYACMVPMGRLLPQA